MDPFAALADPTRRRILELLTAGERTAGDLTATVRHLVGLSQPAVSQHLRVLRDAGLVTVRVDGARRIYGADPAVLQVVADWILQVTPTFDSQLDALATEVARGKRQQRAGGATEVSTTDRASRHRPTG